MFLRTSAALVFLVGCSVELQAAATSPAVRAEIDALLNRMQASSCQFNRNNTWHSEAEAKAHLLRKLEYLEGKGVVKSTEQFIELGATSSSYSGKPYLVKCGTAAAQESKPWLLLQLKGIRAQAASTSAAAK